MADETIGKRLRTGIAKEGWSIREFWRRMEEKAKRMSRRGERVPGVSYPSIRAFVEDKRKPTFAFLEAAADELDLNYAWLVTGAGPASANVLEIKESLAIEEDRIFRDPLAETFPPYRKLPPAIRGVVRMTWLDLRNHKRRMGEEVDNETLARGLGCALAAPLEHLDMDKLGPMRLRQYVLGMCSAVAPLVAGRKT